MTIELPLGSACLWCGRRRHQGRCRRWFDAHPLENKLNNERLRKGRRPRPRLPEYHHPRLSPVRAARARTLRIALDTAFMNKEEITLILREMRELLEAQVRDGD
jgi:hypothetical protein